MDQKTFEAMLTDAETRVRRLRTLYDQWFQGMERTEPRTPKVEVDRLINLLRNDQPRNTALRFRMNQLVQRYTTYTVYWQRIARQIEEGTYKRDLIRARKRFAKGEGGQDATAGEGYDLDIDIDLQAAMDEVTQITRAPQAPEAKASEQVAKPVPPAAASAAPARNSPSKRPPPPVPTKKSASIPPPTRTLVRAKTAAAAAPSPNGLPDEQIARIYERYMDARRKNSERTDNVKVENIAKTVREMMPRLAQKHAGKQIDFDIVVKDGKVALKPVAK